ADRLGLVLDVLAQADLLGHPRGLGNDRFLTAYDGLDRAFREGGIARLYRAVRRPPLDRHPLLTQLDLFLDRALGHIAAYPHAAAADVALANLQLFLSGLHHIFMADIGN